MQSSIRSHAIAGLHTLLSHRLSDANAPKTKSSLGLKYLEMQDSGDPYIFLPQTDQDENSGSSLDMDLVCCVSSTPSEIDGRKGWMIPKSDLIEISKMHRLGKTDCPWWVKMAILKNFEITVFQTALATLDCQKFTEYTFSVIDGVFSSQKSRFKSTDWTMSRSQNANKSFGEPEGIREDLFHIVKSKVPLVHACGPVFEVNEKDEFILRISKNHYSRHAAKLEKILFSDNPNTSLPHKTETAEEIIIVGSGAQWSASMSHSKLRAGDVLKEIKESQDLVTSECFLRLFIVNTEAFCSSKADIEVEVEKIRNYTSTVGDQDKISNLLGLLREYQNTILESQFVSEAIKFAGNRGAEHFLAHKRSVHALMVTLERFGSNITYKNLLRFVEKDSTGLFQCMADTVFAHDCYVLNENEFGQACMPFPLLRCTEEEITKLRVLISDMLIGIKCATEALADSTGTIKDAESLANAMIDQSGTNCLLRFSQDFAKNIMNAKSLSEELTSKLQLTHLMKIWQNSDTDQPVEVQNIISAQLAHLMSATHNDVALMLNRSEKLSKDPGLLSDMIDLLSEQVSMDPKHKNTRTLDDEFVCALNLLLESSAEQNPTEICGIAKSKKIAVLSWLYNNIFSTLPLVQYLGPVSNPARFRLTQSQKTKERRSKGQKFFCPTSELSKKLATALGQSDPYSNNYLSRPTEVPSCLAIYMHKQGACGALAFFWYEIKLHRSLIVKIALFSALLYLAYRLIKPLYNACKALPHWAGLVIVTYTGIVEIALMVLALDVISDLATFAAIFLISLCIKFVDAIATGGLISKIFDLIKQGISFLVNSILKFFSYVISKAKSIGYCISSYGLLGSIMISSCQSKVGEKSLDDQSITEQQDSCAEEDIFTEEDICEDDICTDTLSAFLSTLKKNEARADAKKSKFEILKESILEFGANMSETVLNTTNTRRLTALHENAVMDFIVCQGEDKPMVEKIGAKCSIAEAATQVLVQELPEVINLSEDSTTEAHQITTMRDITQIFACVKAVELQVSECRLHLALHPNKPMPWTPITCMSEAIKYIIDNDERVCKNVGPHGLKLVSRKQILEKVALYKYLMSTAIDAGLIELENSQNKPISYRQGVISCLIHAYCFTYTLEAFALKLDEARRPHASVTSLNILYSHHLPQLKIFLKLSGGLQRARYGVILTYPMSKIALELKEVNHYLCASPIGTDEIDEESKLMLSCSEMSIAMGNSPVSGRVFHFLVEFLKSYQGVEAYGIALLAYILSGLTPQTSAALHAVAKSYDQFTQLLGMTQAYEALQQGQYSRELMLLYENIEIPKDDCFVMLKLFTNLTQKRDLVLLYHLYELCRNVDNPRINDHAGPKPALPTQHNGALPAETRDAQAARQYRCISASSNAMISSWLNKDDDRNIVGAYMTCNSIFYIIKNVILLIPTVVINKAAGNAPNRFVHLAPDRSKTLGWHVHNTSRSYPNPHDRSRTSQAADSCEACNENRVKSNVQVKAKSLDNPTRTRIASKDRNIANGHLGTMPSPKGKPSTVVCVQEILNENNDKWQLQASLH